MNIDWILSGNTPTTRISFLFYKIIPLAVHLFVASNLKMCARKINANAAPRRTGTEGSLPRPTSVGNVMGPKGAVSKNFLYINQHFSSTGLVGGKYI